MPLLRVGGQPETAAQQERASLIRKHFAAFNRKLESMVDSKISPEYVLKAAAGYKLADEDLSDKVLSYIKHLIEKPAAPAAEVKESKKSSKKAEAKADSSDSAAE